MKPNFRCSGRLSAPLTTTLDRNGVGTCVMQILENLGRVGASESILPSVDRVASEQPASPLLLIVSADLHWRRKEWEQAIGLAKRVLELKPRHFHALSILMNSHGHLGQWNDAYLHAQRLMHAKRPNWTLAKLICAIFGVANLIVPTRRQTYHRTLQRCDEEANSDRENLRFAQELVKKHQAANDAVAV